MPKNKTHSGAKKRFRLTGSGKVMRSSGGQAPPARAQVLAATPAASTGEVVLAPADVKRIKRLLGK